MNDISGGASNFPAIQYHFQSAFSSLRDRMNELIKSREPHASILDTILGGNYESFRLQREHLRQVHEAKYGNCPETFC